MKEKKYLFISPGVPDFSERIANIGDMSFECIDIFTKPFSGVRHYAYILDIQFIEKYKAALIEKIPKRRIILWNPDQ